MSLTTIDVTVADGHQFQMLVAEPDRPSRATLMFMPAMGVKASYYEAFARELASVGIRAAVPDLRGLGTSSLRASRSVDFGYVDMLNADVPAAIAALGDGPLCLGGHSLGGQLAVLRAPLEDLAGVVLVACCLPHHAAWRGLAGLRIRAIAPLFRAIAAVAGYFPGDRVGFGGREAKSVINDWAHSAATGRYELSGAKRDWESQLSSLTAPVLAVEIEGDSWCPTAAIDALLAKCPEAEQVRVIAPSGPGRHPHFAWAKNAGPVVAEIDRFIQ